MAMREEIIFICAIIFKNAKISQSMRVCVCVRLYVERDLYSKTFYTQ